MYVQDVTTLEDSKEFAWWITKLVTQQLLFHINLPNFEHLKIAIKIHIEKLANFKTVYLFLTLDAQTFLMTD